MTDFADIFQILSSIEAMSQHDSMSHSAISLKLKFRTIFKTSIKLMIKLSVKLHIDHED